MRLLPLLMRIFRPVCVVLLFALAVALPCADIAPVKQDSGQVLYTLDICSPHSPANVNDAATLVEAIYGLPSAMPVTDAVSDRKVIWKYIAFSPIEKPPAA